MRARKIKLGDRVRVAGCSGIDSDKEGVVIPPQSKWPEGNYKTPGKDELWLRLDCGRVITMFKNRLKVV